MKKKKTMIILAAIAAVVIVAIVVISQSSNCRTYNGDLWKSSELSAYRGGNRTA